MLKLKLDKLLYEKRLNANQLSKMTGIRYPTISDMADNKSKAWSPENLNKIMVALDLGDISELIEYEKEPPQN
ncbi:helix-turn-helix domain-containing protein [Paenibacillus sp. FSL R7-0128]|uniref:helix-turn-helix domain-containing protein n=1 Tax=Paenibacillus sp. FSL R7-0128 TaxID=2954529 RepID=UPI0030FBCF9F